MKLLRSITFFLSIFLTSISFGQTFAHISTGELLESMPEYKAAQVSFEEASADLQLELTTLSAEYEEKYDYLKKNGPLMGLKEFETKENELIELQDKVYQLSTSAESELLKIEEELMGPILKRVQKAVEKVAAKNNYDYVIDTSSGAFMVTPKGDNILELVKKELGL